MGWSGQPAAAVDPVAVVAGENLLKFGVHEVIQTEMADVHEGVKLVVLRLFPTHPCLAGG